VILSWVNPKYDWADSSRVRWFHIQVTPYDNDGSRVDLVFGDPVLVSKQSYELKLPNFGVDDRNYVILPDMTYTWRVRVANTIAAPKETDWSAWVESKFKTGKVSSSTISLISPNNQQEVSTTRPALVWENSDKSVFYYELQVSKDQNFGNNAFLYNEIVHGGQSSPPNTYLIPSKYPLEQGTTYYWRVRPRIQGDGDPVPWSSTWIFKTP